MEEDGWCNYIMGPCAWRNNAHACARISAVACREKREKNLAMKDTKEDKDA